MKRTGILLLFASLLIQACFGPEDDPYAEENALMERQDVEISRHIQQNNINATKDSYGVYHEVIEAKPAGRVIEQGDIAVVNYKITRLDGTLIGESGSDSMRVRYDESASYVPLSLYLALHNMREGETRRLYAPFRYSYYNYELEGVVPHQGITVLELEVKNLYKNASELKLADIAQFERVIAAKEEEASVWGENGIRKVLIEEGTGDAIAEEGDLVGVYYTGSFIDDKVFDSKTSGTPFSFTIGNETVIDGFAEAVKGMREGEKAKFYIPSDQAYGKMAAGASNQNAWFVAPKAVWENLSDNPSLRGLVSIPPHSPLVFELELRSVAKAD